MNRRRRASVALAVIMVTLFTYGCSSEAALSEESLLASLEAAGLTVNRLDAIVSPDQRAKLPTEPKSMFSARIADGHGNNEPMTFIEFSNEADALEATEYQNGFALRNWFVLGTVSNHMKHHIEGAVQ